MSRGVSLCAGADKGAVTTSVARTRSSTERTQRILTCWFCPNWLSLVSSSFDASSHYSQNGSLMGCRGMVVAKMRPNLKLRVDHTVGTRSAMLHDCRYGTCV